MKYLKSWDHQNYLVIRGFLISELFITRFHCTTSKPWLTTITMNDKDGKIFYVQNLSKILFLSNSQKIEIVYIWGPWSF